MRQGEIVFNVARRIVYRKRRSEDQLIKNQIMKITFPYLEVVEKREAHH